MLVRVVFIKNRVHFKMQPYTLLVNTHIVLQIIHRLRRFTIIIFRVIYNGFNYDKNCSSEVLENILCIGF